MNDAPFATDPADDLPPPSEEYQRQHPGWDRPAGQPDPALLDALDVATWAALDIPPEPHFLGSLVTPTTRLFVAGRTGAGKTLFAHAAAAGMATGGGFLHWRSDRPSRWLIIDGEMATPLIKQRSADLIRRAGPIPPGYLSIYARDRAEAFGRLLPGLGEMPPLNSPDGFTFIMKLIEAIRPEGIVFDNVMSLIIGDQKDELPWSDTLPLVAALTKQGIAQLWCDHAGHNADRQYGSSTKAWRFDTLMQMTPLPDDQRAPAETAFALTFQKARRRTPATWQDYEPCTIRLKDDRWTAETTNGRAAAGRLSPVATQWHRALLDALSRSDTPTRTTRTAWFTEAVRGGLTEAVETDDSYRVRDSKQAKFRKYLTEIKAAGLIGVDGETITDLRQRAASPA